MTYEQIIEALECCVKTECISDCAKCEMFAFDCKDILIENALDLINRQKAEIERLQDKIFVLENDLEKAENLSDALGNDVDIKLNHIYDLEENLKKAKSEAIKECLEKVKNYIKTHCNPYGKPDFDYDTSIKILNFIDNLVKEMTEEKEK